MYSQRDCLYQLSMFGSTYWKTSQNILQTQGFSSLLLFLWFQSIVIYDLNTVLISNIFRNPSVLPETTITQGSIVFSLSCFIFPDLRNLLVLNRVSVMAVFLQPFCTLTLLRLDQLRSIVSYFWYYVLLGIVRYNMFLV